MKEAFIFDLDGTLIDSMGVWEEVGNDFLHARGVDTNFQALGEILKPMDVHEGADYLCATFSLKESGEELIFLMNQEMQKRYQSSIPLKKGALEFLEQNRHRPMCVATATKREIVQPALERLNINRFFKFILTSSEVGNSKHEPDIYLQAAEKLGGSPATCVVFEDALHAATTAKNAGFYVVGVEENCFLQDRTALQVVCDEVVRDLRQCSFYLPHIP